MSTQRPPSPRAVILVATDGSAASNEALSAAARFAMMPGSELHIVYVLDPREVAENERALPEAQSIIAHVARAQGVGNEAILHVETGVAWREIVELGSRLQADVIVVGTHDRGAVGRLLLGSVAEQVVKKARCPVFVARRKSHSEGVPEIEPPCEACVAVQASSGGAQLWCERHSEHHAHGRLHYESPPSFGVGSQLIRTP